MYQIEQFNQSDKRLDAFVQFASHLYEGDTFYRPSSTLPNDGQLFLVYQDQVICGRAALHFNPGIKIEEKRTALLGWYECVNDIEASQHLLGAIDEYCNEIGVQSILGPINRDTWHPYRMALPSKRPPFFLDCYHKPWYALQFQDQGWIPIETYHSSEILLEDNETKQLQPFIDRFQKRGITFREIDLDRFDTEVASMHKLSLEAFESNPLYTPISLEKMEALYQPLRQVVDPTFVLIAESEEHGIVSFAFAIRDLFTSDSSSMVIKTIATKPSSGARGTGTLLTKMIHERAKKHGYSSVIHALMHDDNVSAHVLDDRSTILRNYALYEKKVNE